MARFQPLPSPTVRLGELNLGAPFPYLQKEDITAVASVSCFVQECDGVDFFFSSGSIYTKLNHFGMSLTEAGVLT